MRIRCFWITLIFLAGLCQLALCLFLANAHQVDAAEWVESVLCILFQEPRESEDKEPSNQATVMLRLPEVSNEKEEFYDEVEDFPLPGLVNEELQDLHEVLASKRGCGVHSSTGSPSTSVCLSRRTSVPSSTGSRRPSVTDEEETAMDLCFNHLQEMELGAALVAGPANEPGLHPTDFERISDQDSDGADVSKEALRIDCSYREAEKTCQQRLRSEAVDVDGWKLEKSQMELELKILLSCCQHEKNRQRLHAAIKEFEVKLRTRRTWAWFPLPRFQWSGFEYEKPCILLDFHVPGVGSLPPEDVHCDFGVDWFDLKVWNVKWYHHRVKKTRLLRDIVPSESSVEAQGDHLLVKLQKALDPRHGVLPPKCAAFGVSHAGEVLSLLETQKELKPRARKLYSPLGQGPHEELLEAELLVGFAFSTSEALAVKIQCGTAGRWDW
eukprot:g61.t1